MKKILLSVVAAMLVLPGMVEAELKISYDINDNNQNLLTSSESNAVFSTVDYKDGLFDLYKSVIESHDIPDKLINNASGGGGANSIVINKNFKKTINFIKEVDVVGTYIDRLDFNYPGAKLTFNYYSADDTLIKKETYNNGDNQWNEIQYFVTDVKKVKKIEIIGPERNSLYLYELDIFIDPSALYSSVMDLNVANVKSDGATVKWKNVNDSFLTGNKVYLNDDLVYDGATINSLALKDLSALTTYKIKVVAVYGTVEVSREQEFTTPRDTTPPGKVTNLRVVQDGNDIKLTYDMPPDKDFSHVQIQRGTAYLDKEFKDTTYIDTSPNANKLNSYSVRSVDKSGNVSMAATVSIMHDTGEVKSLKAVAPDFTNVQLEWQNTSRNDFEVVKIYRKSADAPLMRRAMNLFSANDGFTPLFETNGTSFKDLTVEPDSKYTYKVTSVVAGAESAGVVTTIKTPKMKVIGSEIDPPPAPPAGQPEDLAAPYIIRWQQPTTGKILVKVGGKDYKVVDAANLSISIPKVDMKYTILGAPDVKLVPINENGEPGEETRPGGGGSGSIGSLPVEFSPTNVIKTSVELAKLVAPFVILYIAFLLAVRLMRFIKNTILPPKDTKEAATAKATTRRSGGGTRGGRKTAAKAAPKTANKSPKAAPKAPKAEPIEKINARIEKERKSENGPVDRPIFVSKQRADRPIDRPLKKG